MSNGGLSHFIDVWTDYVHLLDPQLPELMEMYALLGKVGFYDDLVEIAAKVLEELIVTE